MPQFSKKTKTPEALVAGKLGTIVSLLRDLLIVTLGQSGVSQQKVQELVRGDMNRINRLIKGIKPSKKETHD